MIGVVFIFCSCRPAHDAGRMWQLLHCNDTLVYVVCRNAALVHLFASFSCFQTCHCLCHRVFSFFTFPGTLTFLNVIISAEVDIDEMYFHGIFIR